MQKYPIGFKFKLKRGRRDVKLHTIVDYLTTTNAAGEVTRTEYVTEFEMLGQRVRYNCPQFTIDKATA